MVCICVHLLPWHLHIKHSYTRQPTCVHSRIPTMHVFVGSEREAAGLCIAGLCMDRTRLPAPGKDPHDPNDLAARERLIYTLHRAPEAGPTQHSSALVRACGCMCSVHHGANVTHTYPGHHGARRGAW